MNIAWRKVPDGSFLERMEHYSKCATSPDIFIVFPAQEFAVRRALQSICASLKTMEISQDTLIATEIILAEVTNNIVEHAYVDDPAGTISLSCHLSNRQLNFEIIDNGKMLPGGELPPKKHYDLDSELQELPEGGFGWGLIRDLTRDLIYHRRDDQNRLNFTIDYVAAQI